MKEKNREYCILHAEDNPDDSLLTELAFKQLGLNVQLKKILNGKKVIDSLKESLITSEKLPDLILLDINLPLMNGFEVLNEIKVEEKLSSIPVVFFTSSDSSAEMKYAYENGADLYIRKPNNLNGFKRAMLQAVQLIKDADMMIS
jgi:CheY-like chemotaxis protein